ncbi:hypothetical protein C84B14_16015 [Salinisphaera sp. C84B14]|uniref:Swt1 family HEPN domain-containing protein n=1 Tax=Salinisphaera sp. C84B14 TaxID=1304155 RepID=UPI003341D591
MDELERLKALQKRLDEVTGGSKVEQIRRDWESIDPYARFPGLRSALEARSTANDIVQALDRQDDYFRRLLENTGLGHASRQAQEALDRFNAQFSVPRHNELERMLERFKMNAPSDEGWWRRYQQFREVTLSIQQPWLFVDDPLRSIQSVQRLSDLGEMLRAPNGYGLEASAAIRQHVGDWREQRLWVSDSSDDIDQRSEVYSEVGFDERLIDLPEPAFRETSTRVEVRTTLPGLAELFGAPGESGPGDQLVDNTKEAFAYLKAFEQALRDLIEHEMTKHHGLEWTRSRLPDGMFEQWCRKRAAARDAGSPSDRLIEFADFTDYKQIIMRKANWREVFKAHFRHQEAVNEMFNRVHPVRLAVMHSRPIRRDDEILLYVETTRLFKIVPADLFRLPRH